MYRHYLVIEEGEEDWKNAHGAYAANFARAACELAESEFNQPTDWDDDEERVFLVRDVESGEVRRFIVSATVTVGFTAACDKSYKPQGADNAPV